MESYLDWINKVSSDTEIVPLYFVADFRISPIDKIKYDHEIPVRLCNYVDVYKNTYITSNIEFMEGTASENEIERFTIKDGDIMITKDSESSDDIGIPAIVKGDLDELTVCGYHLALITPNTEKVVPKFLFYCFESKQHRLQIEIESTGVTRVGIPKDVISHYKIPLKSLKYQNKIVAYLDQEVAKIDALVKKKIRLVELLEEKKKATISQAVTKGLNHVKMKSSGIDWLGDIPEHWEIIKLKYTANKISTGTTPDGYDQPIEEDDESIVNWFTPGDFTDNFNLLNNSRRKLTKEIIENNKLSLFSNNSIMFVGIGATLGKVSISDFDFYTNQQLNIIELKQEFDKMFIGLSLSSLIEFSKIYANSATLPILNQQKLGEIQIAVPSLNEQIEISDFLKKYMINHSTLNTKINNSIDLLKEKRTGIISAAINGEINI